MQGQQTGETSIQVVRAGLNVLGQKVDLAVRQFPLEDCERRERGGDREHQGGQTHPQQEITRKGGSHVRPGTLIPEAKQPDVENR